MESFSEVFPTSTQKNVTIIKKKSAYRPPHNSPGGNSGSYIFGPSFNLKSVEIEGNWVSVRDPPAAALVANDAGGGASCPFLFADDGQGAEIALGRVLVGAHSLALSSTTVIKLPDKTRTIFLREFEPELTFISRVVLRSEGEERELVRDKAIEPGQQLVVDIPSMTGSNSYLVVSGYYQTIESVLASKPPAVP